MNRTENEGGFAIVEVLAAIAVLTVLAVGLVGGERGGAMSLRRGFDETRALGLLQAELERARADVAELAVGERELAIDDLPGAALTRTTELLEPGLLRVRVALRWATSHGVLQRELTTWIAREEGR